MDMAIGETREHEVALGIKHLCGWNAMAQNFFICADGKYLAVANCHSLSPGMSGVDGVDAAVKHDRVCGFSRGGREWHPRRKNQQGEQLDGFQNCVLAR